MTSTILIGDAIEQLRTLPDGSVHCCVTSPPYFGLRDYQTGEWLGGDADCQHRVPRTTMHRNVDMNARMGRPEGQRKQEEAAVMLYTATCARCGAQRSDDRQIGLEATPEQFVANLVAVFAEVWRVLRDDGTLWLNLGDSYNAYNGNRASGDNGIDTRRNEKDPGEAGGSGLRVPGLKMKDLIGGPWMVAFALRDAGWYLRSDIVWAKPNPMPESVSDRPTRDHEFVFLLSKRARYHYDADAIREPLAARTLTTFGAVRKAGDGDEQFVKANRLGATMPERKPRLNGDGEHAGANKRDVWTISPEPYHEAHFATMPTKLVEPCVLAGCPERCCEACGAPHVRLTEARYASPGNRSTNGPRSADRQHETAGFEQRLERSTVTLGFEASCDCDAGVIGGTVLDPFSGAATVGVVAQRLNRSYVGIELSAEYAELGRTRIVRDAELGYRAPRRPVEREDQMSLLPTNGGTPE